jgi:catechol 2,3-dioxygenase-like lactoylglutathione lyase family enzyme
VSNNTALIRGTDFVFVPVTSFETAEAFYSGVLGLPCSDRYTNSIGGEFETGSLTIQVIDVAKIGRPFQASTGAIALHVDDVERARNELERRGVEFEGETIDTGVCHQALFRDPDGNHLLLHHRYGPPKGRLGS